MVGYDDYPVVTWRHIYDTNIRDHALVRLDGKMAPVLSHENGMLPPVRITAILSIAADGIYHAAWFSNAPQQHGLFYAHSTDRGRLFQPAEFRQLRSPGGASYTQPRQPRLSCLKEFDGENTAVLGCIPATAEILGLRRQIGEHRRIGLAALIGENSRAYLSWNTRTRLSPDRR
jgi:hypothetical protein